jgi:hypothetical protein
MKYYYSEIIPDNYNPDVTELVCSSVESFIDLNPTNYPNLKILRLFYCHNIPWIPSLEELDCYYSTIYPDILKYISNKSPTKLRDLVIQSCNTSFTLDEPCEFKSVPLLENLVLHTNLNYKLPDPKHVPNLKYLKDSKSSIIPFYTGLEILNITSNCYVQEIPEFPLLTELLCSECSKLILPENLPRLERLLMRHTNINRIPETYRSLKELRCGYSDIRKLPVFPELEELEITNTEYLYDLPKYPKLVHLINNFASHNFTLPKPDDCPLLTLLEFNRSAKALVIIPDYPNLCTLSVNCNWLVRLPNSPLVNLYCDDVSLIDPNINPRDWYINKLNTDKDSLKDIFTEMRLPMYKSLKFLNIGSNFNVLPCPENLPNLETLSCYNDGLYYNTNTQKTMPFYVNIKNITYRNHYYVCRKILLNLFNKRTIIEKYLLVDLFDYNEQIELNNQYGMEEVE